MQMARGESKTFTFTVTDTAGDPVDLEDAEITFTVTDLEGETVLELSNEGEGSQIAVVEGEDSNSFTVSITAEQSDLDPSARWARCVVVTDADPPQTLVVAEHEPFYVTGT